MVSSADEGVGDRSAAFVELRQLTEELRIQLTAHRVEVRDALKDHLQRTAERERAVATALDGLTVQLNQFTSALAAELRRSGEETVSRATSELRAAQGDGGDPRIDALAEAIGRVDMRVAQLAATVGVQLRELVEGKAPRHGAAEGDAPFATQLDAVGRLVHHAVRSLHLIEAATVGVSPRTERDRAEAAAAIEELRTAADARHHDA